MKYQCLQCGAVISEKEENCPECSSKKLIPIDVPLNEVQREEVIKSASKEVTLLIQDLFVREEIEAEGEVREDEEADEDDDESDEDEWENGIRTIKEGIYELNLDNILKSSKKEKEPKFFRKKNVEEK